MKRWKDPFPQTPKGFHDRVEQTLRGLEDRDMKRNRRYRKLTLALVAALIALLAIGAVAAVIGNNQLKDELSDAGAKDMAERVQDVHLTDGGEGFNFAVDEIVWEGEDLFISYTLSVPEDGNTYLAGLMHPRINGEAASPSMLLYLDDDSPTVLALGGEYPASHTLVLSVVADSRELALRDMKLAVSAAFFKTDRPLRYMEIFNEDGNYALESVLIDWNGPIANQKVLPDDDMLYYWNVDGSTPEISLEFFPDVLETMQAEDAEEKGYVTVTRDSVGWPWKGLTPAGLEASGIAALVAERSVELPLSADMVSHDLYNGLEKNTFRYDDMTVTVENFRMTHFKLTADIWVFPDDGALEDDGQVDYNAFPSLFFSMNGKVLRGGYSGGIGTHDDGVPGYREQYECFDYLPMENPGSLELVSCHLDDEVKDYVIDEVVAQLTPVLDETAAEEEAAALATREAAGNWQPGDPDILVWATKNGTYYHLDQECSGMHNAVQWHIANAVDAGKKPCPVCAGGESGPVEWEQGEDISCFDD